MTQLEQINQLSIIGLTFILAISSVFDFLYNYFEKNIILLIFYILLTGIGILVIIFFFNKKMKGVIKNEK
ncbi:MAG: hypothetical protein QW117_03055 [Candidatus Pacearchaeota archaeon]